MVIYQQYILKLLQLNALTDNCAVAETLFIVILAIRNEVVCRKNLQ